MRLNLNRSRQRELNQTELKSCKPTRFNGSSPWSQAPVHLPAHRKLRTSVVRRRCPRSSRFSIPIAMPYYRRKKSNQPLKFSHFWTRMEMVKSLSTNFENHPREVRHLQPVQCRPWSRRWISTRMVVFPPPSWSLPLNRFKHSTKMATASFRQRNSILRVRRLTMALLRKRIPRLNEITFRDLTPVKS